MPTYQVIVSNIGTVYSGSDGKQADSIWGRYRAASQNGHLRVSGESVTLMLNGEPVNEYIGALHE
jgi:hypothetical protein